MGHAIAELLLLYILYAMLLYMLLEVLAATSRDQLTVLQQQEIMAASPELRHVKF